MGFFKLNFSWRKFMLAPGCSNCHYFDGYQFPPLQKDRNQNGEGKLYIYRKVL